MKRLPIWIRTSLKTDKAYSQVCGLLSDLELCTVCASAQCPNRHECWNNGTATFMIMGNVCTRNCTFCAVENGIPVSIDPQEPKRIAQAAVSMSLKHVVITSVTRDDLADGGAGHFTACIQAVREVLPTASIEVLTPDFQGSEPSIDCVLASSPDVFNHNVETIHRLQSVIRPQAEYTRSLDVLRYVASVSPTVKVKSGLMVGLGETREELNQTMRDIYDTGCSILTIGQYLSPSRLHPSVEEFLAPDAFDQLSDMAYSIGFSAVASAPLVRSSYQAEELLRKAI